jgi:hypothetical protein
MAPSDAPRIVLVGCGRHAARAHLPVLADLRDRVTLSAVVDLADQREAVRTRCAAFGFDTRFVAVRPEAPPTAHVLSQCEAVIVSSPPLTHKPYVDAALAGECVAILVDKPLTVPANARSSIGQARSLVREFQDIAGRACGRLVMVGTQRRYHPLYRRIGRHLYDVHAKTGHGVTFVQSLTNDGLWTDRDAYATGGFYDPATTGGGKLINTGYHLLDTVPWLLRHCQGADGRPSDVARIRYADVFAQFFIPDDAVGLVHNGGRGLNGGRAAHPMNEINACLQVAFRDADERTICLWQLGALHEGISARRSPSAHVGEGEDPAGAGRTKQDVLTLYQGPVAAVWMRRIAKLLPSDGVGLGESGHAELICAQNAHLTGADGALEQVIGPYVDTDTAPTEEFVAALLGVTSPDEVASPVGDQAIAVRILAAAYESAATQAAVRVSFDRAEWALPPAASSYLGAELVQ